MKKYLKKYYPLFVLPTIIAFIIAFIVPFIMGVYLSFTEFTTVTNAKFVGFRNYIKIFTGDNGDFINALKFTVAFTLVAVVSVNFISFVFALFLTRGIKGTNAFRTVFFMPNLIGGLILGFIWQLILNGVLLQFNATLLTDAKYGFWGLVVLTNWQMIGYMMIIYIAGIQNIPGELLESASIDGATPLQALFSIKIPMMMPSITICTFLTLTNSFKLFDQNLALTSGGPGKDTAMLALDIYNTFYGGTNTEGLGQAKATLFFLIVAAVALAQVYLTRNKEVDL